MNPYIVATMSRKRSGLATFDHGDGLARCLTTFAVAGIGTPVLAICALQVRRRGVGR